MCWAQPDWPPASAGSWNKVPRNLRTHEVGLLQQVVDWVEHSEGWQIAGRWDPAAHVGALSLIVPDGLTPQDLGSILDVSFDIAVRPGLHCAPYIHRAMRHLSRRNAPDQPRALHHAEQVSSLLRALAEITAGVL